MTAAKPHAGPSVRRFARELGVDLSKIVGSGPKQRILKEDIQAFVKRELMKLQSQVWVVDLIYYHGLRSILRNLDQLN